MHALDLNNAQLAAKIIIGMLNLHLVLPIIASQNNILITKLIHAKIAHQIACNVHQALSAPVAILNILLMMAVVWLAHQNVQPAKAVRNA